jgi:hypothetical protein
VRDIEGAVEMNYETFVIKYQFCMSGSSKEKRYFYAN